MVDSFPAPSGVVIRDYEAGEGLSHLLRAVDDQRPREIRMSWDLFLSLANDAQFQNAFDPAAMYKSVEAGYMGVLCGTKIVVIKQPMHADVTSWPRDKVIVFY